MNKKPLRTLIAAAGLFLGVLPALLQATPDAGKPQQLRSLDETPKGLAKSDWQSIRAAFEAGQHAFQPIEGGWQARNPGQQWTTKFDLNGFLTTPEGGGWTWGLELQSYGFGETQTPVSGAPAVKAEGQRLSYQWDATVQEWFVNDQRGLEHGFIVSRRPDQTGSAHSSELAFTLRTRGGLQPKVSPNSVQFQDSSGAAVLNYSGLKVWDADGKILPVRFEPAGLSSFRLLVDESTARYPITIDPIAQQAYLKASNSGAGDNFGYSVAVDGDTAVIGAPDEDSNATTVNGDGSNNSAPYSGAAYVFTRSGGVWTQQAYLKASNSEVQDYFGYSVAVSGDTAVIGALGESSNATTVNGDGTNNSAERSGAAYVFTRSAGVWTQQAYLKASNSGAGNYFGLSVAVSGDTAVIGAYRESSNAATVNGDGTDNSAPFSGAAYVFTRSGGVWTQQAYLKASNSETGDLFGISVAVSGDTAVIGAGGEDSNATTVNGDGTNNSFSNYGAAYVFIRSGEVWTQQAYLKASNSGANDGFGGSVAVDGDTAVIGASWESSNAKTVNGNGSNNSAVESGAAYVFTRSGGVWTQQAYLKASNSSRGDHFGASVAVDGDTAVIGAFDESSNATTVNGNGSNNSAVESGAAYVFTRSGGVWTQQAYLKASNSGAWDHFGLSVAVSGDSAVIGAYRESSNATIVNGDGSNRSAEYSGAVYVFINRSLTVSFPTVQTTFITQVSPSIVISGNAGSLVGLDRVEVEYDGISYLATLGASSNNTTVPWSFHLTPSGDGPVSLTIRAYDLNGNVTTLTRNFLFARRYPLSVVRVVPDGFELTPDLVGSIDLVAVPKTASGALVPKGALAQMTTVGTGAEVILTAKPRAGYVFSHWSGLPAGAIETGGTAKFFMPAAAVSEVTAEFIVNPFLGLGAKPTFFGTLEPTGMTEESNATNGFVQAALSTAKGGFSGTVRVDGVTQKMSGQVFGNGSVFFKLPTGLQPELEFGGRTLTAQFVAGKLNVTLNSASGVSFGQAEPVLYRNSAPVPSWMLIRKAKATDAANNQGYFTVSLPALAAADAGVSTPLSESEYPQGSGYLTLTVAANGLVTVAGVLADGTAVTGATGIVGTNLQIPLYAALSTPGTATKALGGALLGRLQLADVAGAHVASVGAGLKWFRPTVAELTASATVNGARASATQLFTAGWPGGLWVGARGALYLSAVTLEAGLVLDPAAAPVGNALFAASGGKLANAIAKSNLNITGNVATKSPVKDPSYSVKFVQTTGIVSGAFDPVAWQGGLSKAKAQPAVRGIVVQGGTDAGAFGFFLSNATGDKDPESGRVSVTKP
jgi:hypothetical protein